MQDLAKGIRTLAGQLDKLEEVPKSDGLRTTIGEFPGMMEEVVDFIEKWLESWSGVFSGMRWIDDWVVGGSQTHPRLPHKDRAIELQRNWMGSVLDLW